MGLTKKEIWKTFNNIAPSYDITNRLLSFGLDVAWRTKVAHRVAMIAMPKQEFKVLDLATGTADLAISMAKKIKSKSFKVLGIDMADKMLEIGQEKIKKEGLSSQIALRVQDATNLKLKDDQFDVATVAFGVRNFEPLENGLAEINRVLKPHGKLIVLEFSMPTNPVVKLGYLIYLRYILPIVGGIFSGNYKAYKYLNSTVEDFPYGEAFFDKMIAQGFDIVDSIPLCFGVATIYVGEKTATPSAKRTSVRKSGAKKVAKGKLAPSKAFAQTRTKSSTRAKSAGVTATSKTETTKAAKGKTRGKVAQPSLQGTVSKRESQSSRETTPTRKRSTTSSTSAKQNTTSESDRPIGRVSVSQ